MQHEQATPIVATGATVLAILADVVMQAAQAGPDVIGLAEKYGPLGGALIVLWLSYQKLQDGMLTKVQENTKATENLTHAVEELRSDIRSMAQGSLQATRASGHPPDRE